MKLGTALSVIFLAVLMDSGSVRAGGTVAGTVPLDAPKPPPVSAGYKPQTARPVEKSDPPVAIIYLEGAAGASAAKAGGKVRIRQRGYQFRPSFLAISTGTTVEFPNEDGEFHNVFSYSKAKRFDLGRYRSDEPPKVVTFDKPGLAKIYCEIHQHMRCVILVLDTPWFATTDAAGRFRITGVPPGTYTVKALLPSEKTIESRVTIVEGKTATVSFGR